MAERPGVITLDAFPETQKFLLGYRSRELTRAYSQPGKQRGAVLLEKTARRSRPDEKTFYLRLIDPHAYNPQFLDPVLSSLICNLGFIDYRQLGSEIEISKVNLFLPVSEGYTERGHKYNGLSITYGGDGKMQPDVWFRISGGAITPLSSGEKENFIEEIRQEIDPAEVSLALLDWTEKALKPEVQRLIWDVGEMARIPNPSGV